MVRLLASEEQSGKMKEIISHYKVVKKERKENEERTT